MREMKLTYSDMLHITKVLYSGMKHRPDHDDIIKQIGNNEIICDEVEVLGNCCNVRVSTKDGMWCEWVYLNIENGDISESGWNDMYMDDIRNDSNVFDMVSLAALSYAETVGAVVYGDNGYELAA